MSGKKINLSVIIPVYNESQTVQKTITGAIRALKKSRINKYEIIVVNDGSTDNSLSLLQQLKRRKKINLVISQEGNRGYGASLKTGIQSARHPWILIIDADNTYPSDSIPELIRETEEHNMVIGARTKRGAKIPKTRLIPKKILLLVANLLTGEKIPDLNSGMRIFEKSLAREFWHLLPKKFSFTSTITLASHLRDYKIKYIPIHYQKRKGKSSIKPVDFIYFMGLVIRLVVYFDPLRFFFWPGIAFTAIGGAWVLLTAIKLQNITDSGVLVFFIGIQTAFFGLIADLIVKTREEYKNENSIN